MKLPLLNLKTFVPWRNREDGLGGETALAQNETCNKSWSTSSNLTLISVDYEPKALTSEMMMRRRATPEEIAQGEAEMRKAEKRMPKENEERGEKPLEDSKEGSQQEVSGEVSAPPIADGPREDSKGNPSPDSNSGVAPGTEKKVPPTLPPAEPPKFATEEFSSPGLRTPKPQDRQDQRGEKATMSSKKETSSNLGPEASWDKKGQARGSPAGEAKGNDRNAENLLFPPIFTPEQLQHMAFIHSQAPWLYGQPQSAFTPNVP